MPWYEKKWWRNIVGKKAEREKLEPVKDIAAILEFLEDVPKESERLRSEFKKLEELESEREVARKELAQANLQAQADVLDKLLERYAFFQNDVDISGIRMQRIGQAFLQHAEEAGLKELVKKKKKKAAWKFGW